MNSDMKNNSGDLLEGESNKIKQEQRGSKIIIFLSYVLFAGIATIVDMGVLFILTTYFNLYYLISAIFSYICGMIINYSFNKYLTFKNKSKRIAPQFAIFATVALIGLGLNELILLILTEIFNVWYLNSKLISVGIVMFWSFFAHKKITFKVDISRK